MNPPPLIAASIKTASVEYLGLIARSFMDASIKRGFIVYICQTFQYILPSLRIPRIDYQV